MLSQYTEIPAAFLIVFEVLGQHVPEYPIKNWTLLTLDTLSQVLKFVATDQKKQSFPPIRLQILHLIKYIKYVPHFTFLLKSKEKFLCIFKIIHFIYNLCLLCPTCQCRIFYHPYLTVEETHKTPHNNK
jgi:hypothetical protein